MFAAPTCPPPGFAAPVVPAARAAADTPSSPHYHRPYEDLSDHHIPSSTPPQPPMLLTHNTTKKRGRPRKTPVQPGMAAATSAPKRRGRPPKRRSVDSSTKKKKPGRPTKSIVSVDPASVYIIPQSEQLNSDFLQNFPGAAAIVLPKSLLTVKAAENSVIIFPNLIKSLIDASEGKKKPGRPKNVDIKGKLIPSMKVGRKPGRPRKNSVVLNHKLLGMGEGGHYNSVTPVVKGPGRPWKIRDMLVPGNVQKEIPKKAGRRGIPESVHGIQDATNLKAKKRSVGRPRKKAIA